MAGSHGAFWASRDSADLLRLDVVAEDIPPNVPVSEITTQIDFGRLRIGSADVLAPQFSELIVTTTAGSQSRNRMEFSQCRKYNAESAIRFDTDAVTAQAIAAIATEEIYLPADLLLNLQLDTPVDSKTAAEGDLITAHLQTAAGDRIHTSVPQGAIVHGRIRRLESYTEPETEFIVGLEFSEIEF